MKKTYDTLPELTLKYRHNETIQKVQIRSASDSERVLRQMYDADTLEYLEACIVIYLNRANKTIGWMKVSQGGITGTVVDARIIIATALKVGACGIIISHNHPSGNLEPSSADDKLTMRLNDGCNLLDIKLLDHLIITAEGYYSYSEMGKL